ncbi:MAG: GFA family protein [Thiobacillus sp.]
MVSGTLPSLYQCHCSLCRKVTGSAANAALIVPSERFQWVCGLEHVASYVGKGGYRADFCSNCGSPLPNPLRGGAEYWIPAGLLEDNANLEVGAHLHVESKASWEVIATGGVQYQEAPGLEGLLKVLWKNADG